MAIERYRLANPAAQLPMPDRGGRLFTASPEGEAVDMGDRFWATLIADGDLVPAIDIASRAATQPPSPGEGEAAGAPAGRATMRDARSGLRPSADASPAKRKGK